MDNIKKIQFDTTDIVTIQTHDNKNIKHIDVDLTPKKEKEKNDIEEEEREPEPKLPRKRVITTRNEWTFTEDELYPDVQVEYVKQIYSNNTLFENKEKYQIILQQLKTKLAGYRSQDVIKKKYSAENFINIDLLLQLLVECNCCCFYCKSITLVLYENVREPMQWSLERIDNSIGHNKDNVVIACLNCNLRRRTMHQERYLFTKQLVLVKKE
jgi:hypothetical protein